MRLIVKILLFILIMIGVFDAPIAWGETDCNKHKLYCAIVKLRPDMRKEWAMELSNAVYKYSKKYGLDPYRSLAIGMQESSLKRINRKQEMVVLKETCDENEVCEVSYEIVEGYTDISLWQFHVKTIKAYNMDLVRLSTDIDYATELHFKLLKQKTKECAHLGDDAWTCYHSATKKHRLLYKQLVDVYYWIIDGR
jgi:ribosomal protein L7Ae-like RNA K-turn-binding protein